MSKNNVELGKGETLTEDGKMVLRNGVPVAALVGGRRVKLQGSQRTTGHEEVLKVHDLPAVGEEPRILARVKTPDGSEQLQIRKWFIPSNENGILPREEWKTKNGRAYKTMEIEGDTVCFSVVERFPANAKDQLQSIFARA